MRKSLTISLLVFLLMPTAAVFAEDAKSITDEMRKKQIKRWEGVTSYVVTQSVAGQQIQTYYQRAEVLDDAGKVHPVFVPVSASALSAAQGATPTMTPEALELYAQSAETVGAAASKEMGDGLEQNGLPRGLLSGSDSEPWLSADPGTMMGGMATFTRAAAEGQKQDKAEYASDAQDTAKHMADFAEKARLIGTEMIDGRKAYHLQVSDLDQVQDAGDGEEFVLQTINVWVDTKKHVPLQMKMEGEYTTEGKTRQMTIERGSSDYRDVPGSKMYESYRQVMKIGGAMDAEQMAELQKAQKEIAKFEKQMAGMSESERAMMEKMMGGRLEMMRSMAAGEGFRTETVIHDIQVNPDLTNLATSPVGALAPSQPASSQQFASSQPVSSQLAPSQPATSSGDSLTQMVQRDLAVLGYNPGNTNGENSTATAIAISKFQSERGMAVTGEASPQLAGILSAEVDRKNNGGAANAYAPATMPTQDPAALQSAQQACLQKKMAAAEKSQKKKRGLGRLMSAVTRTASQKGNYEIAGTMNDVYSAGATADDLAAAAKDLGLTEDDVAKCQNPG